MAKELKVSKSAMDVVMEGVKKRLAIWSMHRKMDHSTLAEVAGHLSVGAGISAIKFIRERTGVGIAEARLFVDEYAVKDGDGNLLLGPEAQDHIYQHMRSDKYRAKT